MGFPLRIRRAGPPRNRLAPGLEDLVRRYDTGQALVLDPLQVVLEYEDPGDRECAAWVSACLAYGKVAPMLRAIRAALAPLGPHPARWLRASGSASVRECLLEALAGWAWRFHTPEDLVEWMLAWKHLDARGGLESHFLPRGGETADDALSRVVQALRSGLPRTYGLRFSLPDPREGSACKRWRIFLRWMARTGWPDLGLWTRYPSRALIIPLDTHVARVARFLALSHRRTADGIMAMEVTNALKGLDPADPLRFDFALSHLGILGDCPGFRAFPRCGPCPLHAICRAGSV